VVVGKQPRGPFAPGAGAVAPVAAGEHRARGGGQGRPRRCTLLGMKLALKILTAWNLALPGLILLLLVATLGFGLGIGRGDALDLVAFVVAWTWVGSSPIAGLAGLALGWRQRVWWAVAIHVLALVFWGAGFFFVLLAPGLPDLRMAK
jgi:hypothetical protein